MAFSPNHFPAALAEIKRLAEENERLRQQLAELKKPDGEVAADKRGRSKNQEEGIKS